ncbi:MAG: thioredoxin-like domain-containing protein [Planctomycetaceae bacterium]|nr:redoxin family protein [Planctomycetaceae bacterium]
MTRTWLRMSILAVAAVVLAAAAIPLWACPRVTAAPTATPADAWAAMFPDGLVDAAGKKVSLDQLKGKVVGIYFSAHWCPPCRAFTPKLVEFRDKNDANFEVVFVSADRTADAKTKYMTEAQMKWPSVPFAAKSAKALMSTHQVRGIPMLVILSPGGKVISKNGRGEVMSAAATCLDTWKKAGAEADAK